MGGRAADYGKMLLTELKPMIDAKYRTKTGRDSTAVGGSSLGGILSLFLGFTHPEAFSKALAVSPSVWWNHRDLLNEIGSLPGKLPLKIWLDCGDDESADEVADVRATEAALESKGWQEGKDLAVFIDYGAKHNEVAWARRFPLMLMYLYGRR